MMTEKVLEKALDGERISPEEAVQLFQTKDMLLLGNIASRISRKKLKERVVTYIVDRNINYTNICITDCAFCAFYRKEGDEESYVHPFKIIAEKIEEIIALGGRQILLQGGHNINLKIDYFENLFRNIKERFDIHLHALSPPEIVHTAKISKLTVVDKCSTTEWLDVMDCAHGMNIPTTATMMFGHVETVEDRVEHLRCLREQQDKTMGFTAFIPWPFQPGRTELSLDHDINSQVTGLDYLKTLAISRIFLDNFDNLQSSWVTQGPKIGQMALYYGANDMGSTMLEENVVRAAGTVHCLNEEDIRRLITDSGFKPQRRNMRYGHVN
ncbi:MAG TPA: dehypoxanthine futalosine cyclase [Nitrospinaceae bacterium]|nr:dehypoxanthine futalosine cyclase [Nitrospinaceae bacterium]